ncbi:succinate--CoA ligase subunit alpha [Alloyangia pacifica]|uniref:Succinyl-CoA synthetase alpha subunit n=1 Tax=Alloyangia pacifica TaxID=311180 RepID=A0A1I6WNL2_9RHOB|nr:CoA-binding protein [Alloyangia pacifica]SDI99447.1 succinyl-CoA synthetase alpha subunit [Alloyangia pacifica]SFT27610.1 succinyl-CoA synthetase alpha subunit [Alloyangia pacifica]
MSILIDKSSRVLIQGITGSTGRIYAERMKRDGTPLVGGVTPGRGGQEVAGVPVFDTMAEAVAATGADCVLSAVRPSLALDAVYEAVSSGIRLMVLYSENVPVHDAMKMCAFARAKGVQLLGPNSAGVISPGKANMADISLERTRPGRIGIVSKSGTLTYEAMDTLHAAGLGTSSIVCLGGDPVVGTEFAEVLRLFDADPDTDAVVLIGEPGGGMEFRAAEAVREMGKPVVAYLTGRNAPAEKRMGHAGAVSSASGDTSAAAKAQVLEDAGARIAPRVTQIGAVVAGLLGVGAA